VLVVAEGKRLFSEAFSDGRMECYFTLASQFRTQDEPAFCGLSTLVMTLNALSIDPGRVVRHIARVYVSSMAAGHALGGGRRSRVCVVGRWYALQHAAW
jgi:hypothetical protein